MQNYNNLIFLHSSISAIYNRADYDLWQDFDRDDVNDYMNGVNSFISGFEDSGLAGW